MSDDIASTIVAGVKAAHDANMDYFNTGYSLWKDAYNRRWAQNERAYQRQLQKTIFNREDTAVQRRVADLEAAGLNPLLAAGSAANSGSITAQVGSPEQSGKFYNSLNLGEFMDAVKTDIKSQREMQKAQLAGQEKSNELIEAQKIASEAAAAASIAAARKSNAAAAIDEYNKSIFEEFGIPTNASSTAKDLMSFFKHMREMQKEALERAERAEAEKALKPGAFEGISNKIKNAGAKAKGAWNNLNDSADSANKKYNPFEKSNYQKSKSDFTDKAKKFGLKLYDFLF